VPQDIRDGRAQSSCPPPVCFVADACSYESIHNDLGEPAGVWYELFDRGARTRLLYGKILQPGMSTEPKKFALSVPHQVCVSTPSITRRKNHGPEYLWFICMHSLSPTKVDHYSTVLLSRVLDQGMLVAHPSTAPLGFELLTSGMRGSADACVMLILFSVASCAFAVLGPETLLCAHKFRWRLQEPMMHT